MRDDREATTTTGEALTDTEVDDYFNDLQDFLNDPARLLERALELLTERAAVS